MKSIRVSAEGLQETEVSVSEVYKERPLSAVLARAGFVLNTRCGQKGLCRGCEVRLQDGALVKSCQLTPLQMKGSTVFIPEKSLIQGGMSVAVDFQPRCSFEINPLFDCEEDRHFGLCIDIGTTTVVMALVDLEDGKIVDRASGYNAQVRMGEDVLTRIDACTKSPDAITEGQRLIIQETLEKLWIEIAGRSNVSGANLAGAVVAGNTTMLHLLIGADPSSMGKVPFTPSFIEARRIGHAELPWNDSVWQGAESIEWYLLPGYAAYVGADISGGWLASGMADGAGTQLLIDIGTNGEILLQHKGVLTGCATAAGPAFEGTQLSWGTRAIEGAVSRIQGNPLDPESLTFEYVGRRKPRSPGLCGSAYIDFLAIGIRSGLLQSNGRFDPALAESSGARLIQGDFGRAWLLNPQDPEGPSISEADLALLLQAKAAIAAGIEILINQSGVSHASISEVYLAGGFGLNLGIESAITCRLLAGFQADQIEVVGNTSLGGAYVCLMDRKRALELEKAASGVRIIELNEDPEFEDTYIDHLALGE